MSLVPIRFSRFPSVCVRCPLLVLLFSIPLGLAPARALAQDAPADLGIYCIAQVNTSDGADLLLAQAEKLAAEVKAGKAADKNWNDVIEIYSVVLKRYPDAVHGIGDEVYVMAGAHCRDRILALPKEGLEAYAARYNPEAERRLRAAKESADPAELRNVVKTYFATAYGDDACYELANYYLENGQFDAALGMLEKIRSHPAPDIDPAVIWVRKAICLKRTGRSRELAELLAKPLDDKSEFRAAGRVWRVGDFLRTEFPKLSPFEVSELGAGASWPLQGGNSGNDARIPDLSSRMTRVWSYPFSDWFNRTANPESPQQFHPVATADTVYVLTNSGLCAVWSLSGVERWRVWARWGSQGRALGPALAGPLVIGTFANFTHQGADTLREIGRRLWAYDAQTGEFAWNYTEPDIFASYRVTPNSEAPPILVGNRLYAYQFREEKKVWRPWGGNHPTLACLDPKTGHVLWETRLAVVPNQGRVTGRHCDGSVPVEHGGVIYVQTNCGVIGAVDASSGETLWLKRYNQVPAATDEEQLKNTRKYVSWWPVLPVVYAGVVYAAPTDADSLHGLDAATGRTVLSLPRGEARQFLGADYERLYLAEAQKVVARDRASGQIAWERPLDSAIVGRGAMSANAVYVPTGKAIECIRLRDGKADSARSVAVSAPEHAGNLIAVKTELGTFAFTASNTHLNGYYDVEEVLGSARRLESGSAGEGALGRFVRAEVLRASGKAEAALAIYSALVKSAPVESKYGGRPVRLLAQECLFLVHQGLARRAEEAGDVPRAIAAWQETLAIAVNDDQTAAARIALARLHEAAGNPRGAVDVYQAILASGTRAERECSGGVRSDLRQFAVRRIRALVQQAGSGVYAAHEADAEKLWNKAQALLGRSEAEDVLSELVTRYPNSSNAPRAFEALMNPARNPRAAIRYAGQLLTLLPETASARAAALEYVGRKGVDYVSPRPKLADPVLLRWAIPKEEQDQLTQAFFIHEIRPKAGPDAAKSRRLLLGVMIRGRNGTCNLQCVDLDQKKVVWESTLASPKLEPAAIYVVALANDLIAAATGADVFGIDPETGATVWKYSPESVVKSIAAAGKVVVVALDDGLVGLEAGSGARLWNRTVTGYVYDGPHVQDGFACVLTRVPDKMYILDVLGGSLVLESALPDLPARDYGWGPWVARQGNVLAVTTRTRTDPPRTEVAGYDLTTGQRQWTCMAEGAGRLVARGPWLCVTPTAGYGFHVASARFIDPKTGATAWSKDFPSPQPRETAGGGEVLDATESAALCSWFSGGNTGTAVLYDLKANKELWSYSFPAHDWGKAAFLGRILESHAVVFTARPTGFTRTVQIHFIGRETGKGTNLILDAGKSGEHSGYGGFAALPLDDAVVVSAQTGLCCYGSRTPAEVEQEANRLLDLFTKQRHNYRAAVQAAELFRSLDQWDRGFKILNDAFSGIDNDEDYGIVFRIRRTYREGMALRQKPIEVPRAEKPPKIDGELDDWGKPTVVMDKPTYFDHAPEVRAFAAYNIPNDCTARLYFGWDDKCLYVAADVEDDTFVTTLPKTRGRWSAMAGYQDMLRLAFAHGDAEKVKPTGAFQVAAASQPRKPIDELGTGEPAVAPDKAAEPTPPDPKAVQRHPLLPLARDAQKDFQSAGMAVRARKQENGVWRITYEIALPWSCTGLFQADKSGTPPPGGTKPAKGFKFRMLLTVRDQDEPVLIRWLGLGLGDFESNPGHGYVPVTLN